jgi:glucoamylase
VVKHVLADPHRSVLLQHTKLHVLDEALRGKLRLYALLAPHIARYGAGNSGNCSDIGATRLLHAQRPPFHLVMACSPDFTRRSVGFVGASDGWQDLKDNFKMDWDFHKAEDGNIALTGEIALPDDGEFTIGIACGRSYQSAATRLLQSLAEPFASHRERYVRQWQRAVIDPIIDFSKDTGDEGGMYRLSRCVLLAHEDKTFQGALVASLSIPWGGTKGDNDLGGYHLVWTRDLVQSATALLATGQTATPLRALIWLAAVQRTDGSFPQNTWINGTPNWKGLQLDEVAAPILLAWRLHQHEVPLGLFDPGVMIMRAATYLILQGPVTSQERWEDASGYSSSTLASVIAGLVCAAEYATVYGQTKLADFILVYADWLAAHVEEWTVTTNGELVKGIPRYYVRINPTDPIAPDPHADPNTTVIQIANSGGRHPARNVVGGDFLHLVRLGIRAANDPIVLDSIKVIDRVLKRELPQGPSWRRYNWDGYGQKDDGSAFDGTGVGRCWPILTGERGHYELAAGRDPKRYIEAIERFANEGGMLTEQLWDDDDLPDGSMKRGCPTGAAMPLCWSHAEYVSLVRSRHDGICFDRIEPAFQRYVVNPVESRHEIWSLRHPLRRVPRGKILRIIFATEATIVWSADGWARTNTTETAHQSALNLWFADFPTADWPEASIFEFTCFWKGDQRWQGHNWQVSVVETQTKPVKSQTRSHDRKSSKHFSGAAR